MGLRRRRRCGKRFGREMEASSWERNATTLEPRRA
jgi:hypothetical protein